MKQKTNKAARKRFTISARGKVRHLRTHRSHFNAKDSGNETRRKHAPRSVNGADLGRIADLLPYA
jgi:large subunit ribosomal protein L35